MQLFWNYFFLDSSGNVAFSKREQKITGNRLVPSTDLASTWHASIVLMVVSQLGFILFGNGRMLFESSQYQGLLQIRILVQRVIEKERIVQKSQREQEKVMGRKGDKDPRQAKIKGVGPKKKMLFYKSKYRTPETQRNNSIFKLMAQFIKTRTPLQCRSHHQKLEVKYRYPNRIISDYKAHSDLSLYRTFRQQVSDSLFAERSVPAPIRPKVSTQEIEIQTDLMGLNMNYIYQTESRMTAVSQSGLYQGQGSRRQMEGEQFQVKTQSSIHQSPFFYYPFNPPF